MAPCPASSRFVIVAIDDFTNGRRLRRWLDRYGGNAESVLSFACTLIHSAQVLMYSTASERMLTIVYQWERRLSVFFHTIVTKVSVVCDNQSFRVII